MTPAKTPNALVIGSNGTIGQALADQLRTSHQVFTLSRQDTDYSDASLLTHQQKLAEHGNFNRIVCCIGTLHSDTLSPEKRLAHINQEQLAKYFYVNSILPMLCLKHFSALLEKSNNPATGGFAVFACLSAMVGSIEDNRMGGWYGYRSSKAALNMLVRTTAIEVGRTNANAIIAAIHPGTTKSGLSAPFSTTISDDKYYSPDCTAGRICHVMDSLEPQQSGEFFNWDGNRLAW